MSHKSFTTVMLIVLSALTVLVVIHGDAFAAACDGFALGLNLMLMMHESRE